MAEPRRTTGTDADDLAGARLLIVEARFYDDIADALLAGAARAIEAAGGTYERVSVPGSLEVPPAIAIALDAAERAGKPFDGAVGARLRHPRRDAAFRDRVVRVGARADGPVGGAAYPDRQRHHHRRHRRAGARTRAGSDKGDKGGDAARAALALIRLKRRAG